MNNPEKPGKSEVQAALNFVARLRRDLDADPTLGRLLLPGGLDALLAYGEKKGFVFSREALREAHRQDWRMRLLMRQQEMASSSDSDSASTS